MNSEDLDSWLVRRLAEARLAHPGVEADDDDVGDRLRRKVAALGDPTAFAKLRATDLFLAFACLRGDPVAIETLEAQYIAVLDRPLSRTRLSAAAVDDLKAVLREMLLFGVKGAPPLLGDYGGRGDLSSWIRSIALRLATRTREGEDRHVAIDESLGALATHANPELLYLRQAHAAAFGEALAAALSALEARDRNLLRQRYLDDLDIDELGRLYGVHRATVARWIAAARASVLDRVKASLSARMTPSELESFLRMADSDLDLQISVLLGEG